MSHVVYPVRCRIDNYTGICMSIPVLDLSLRARETIEECKWWYRFRDVLYGQPLANMLGTCYRQAARMMGSYLLRCQYSLFMKSGSQIGWRWRVLNINGLSSAATGGARGHRYYLRVIYTYHSTCVHQGRWTHALTVGDHVLYRTHL